MKVLDGLGSMTSTVPTTDIGPPSVGGTVQGSRVIPMHDPVNCGSCISAAGSCQLACAKGIVGRAGVGVLTDNNLPDLNKIANWPPRTSPVHDAVKKPAHYTFGDIEVIDFIDQIVAHYPPELGFYVANVIKYVSRAPHKGKLSEDLSKAEFYLRRAINKSCALKQKVQRD